MLLQPLTLFNCSEELGKIGLILHNNFFRKLLLLPIDFFHKESFHPRLFFIGINPGCQFSNSQVLLIREPLVTNSELQRQPPFSLNAYVH